MADSAVEPPVAKKCCVDPAAGGPASADSEPELEYASSCCIPTTFKAYQLVGVRPYSHDTSIFEFGLEEGQSLGLPVCGCILMATTPSEGSDEEVEVRPYTPISDNSMLGKFELIVKRYPAWGSPSFPHNYKPPGKVSNYIHSLEVGAMVKFKHIAFNIKKQYPFTGVRTITMLAVGVGIAPMLQALHSLLTTPGDATQIVFLYGNRAVRDILMREQLDSWAEQYSGRFKMVYVVGTRWKDFIIGCKTEGGGTKPQPPEGLDALNKADGSTIGVEGWVDEARVKEYAFPPADDTQVFVCGLPSVYDSLCGPRTEKALAPMSVLSRLGYSADMVFKF